MTDCVLLFSTHSAVTNEKRENSEDRTPGCLSMSERGRERSVRE